MLHFCSLLPNSDKDNIAHQQPSCLTATGTNNGDPVILQLCSGTDLQGWTIPLSAFGPISIGGKCLDVTGGADANGTPLQVWDCFAGSANQKWLYFPNSLSTTPTIQWAHHSRCVNAVNRLTGSPVRCIIIPLALPFLTCLLDSAIGLWGGGQPDMDPSHNIFLIGQFMTFGHTFCYISDRHFTTNIRTILILLSPSDLSTEVPSVTCFPASISFTWEKMMMREPASTEK